MKPICSRILLASTLLAVAGCGPRNAYVAPPMPEVTVARPERRTVPIYLEYTGATRAIESVDLRARVRGFLKERNFEDGALVKKGQLLMVIDEQPFQIKVDQMAAMLAEAEANREKAKQSKGREVAAALLAVDQAQLLLSQVEETRQRVLVQRNAGTKEEFDRATATLKKSEAQVESDKASLEQAKADYQTNILAAEAKVAGAKSDLDNARIDLGYCRIVAPFDGRISRHLVDVGNLVGDGQATILSTILRENPMYAYMSVSEADVLRFREKIREGVHGDYQTTEIPLDMRVGDEPGYPHRGRVDYVDPNIDPATGTIQARGLFPNADNGIIAGLFVRVRVALETRKDALLVPERSLGADQSGRYVLVVDKDDVVHQKRVKIGGQIGEMVIIETGSGVGDLLPDDLVVDKGLQKAREGIKVRPKMAAAEATPAAGTKTASR